MAPTDFSIGEQTAFDVLDALNPLLESQDAAIVLTVVAAIREANPPAEILASSLYIFSKLVLLNPDCTSAFREVVGYLVSTTLLPRQVLYEAIDVETHQLLEPTIARPAQEKRMRTRLWYTQTRFNLFGEASEGYAKVITLLGETIEATQPVDQRVVVKQLLALVGQFSLDTNRIIELVLSAAADVITGERERVGNLPLDHRLPPLFVSILDEFPRDHVHSVLGAIMQSYHPVNEATNESATSQQTPSPPTATAAGSEKTAEVQKTPDSLYYLIGILMREGRMRISDVWHNLYPRDDRELARKFLKYDEQIQALAKHVGSPYANRPQNAQTPAIFKRGGSSASKRDILTHYSWVTSGPFPAFSYQKLHFICVLIIMCRVDDVFDAIRCLGVNGTHIDIAAHPFICQALGKFAEALLNPLLNNRFPGFYASHSHISQAIGKLGGRANRCPGTVATVDELLDNDDNGPGAVIVRLLQILGPHAMTIPRVLQALCKLVRGRQDPRAITIMQDVVLPAASLLQSNVGLTEEIWSVLRGWSHEVRWRLYGNLHNQVAATSAVYQLVASQASYEMRYVLKRLTKETQKQHVTTIGKITRGQALPAFAAAIDRVQGYPPDVVTISPVIDACQDCSHLAVDMLLFLIVDRMADSRRSRLKDDGINIAQWYATLSLFLGLCLRKLPVTPQQIEGVLGFLYTKLVIHQEALLITALSDIIKCVAGVEVESNLTAKQVMAHGGGRALRDAVSGIWARLQPDSNLVGNVFDSKEEREQHSAVVALLTACRRTEMHVPIAIAIAQMSRDAAGHEDLRTMPLKLGANIVDIAQSSLSQLSRFMNSFSGHNDWERDLEADIWRPLQEMGISTLMTKMSVLTPFAVVLMSPTIPYLRRHPTIYTLDGATKIRVLKGGTVGASAPFPEESRKSRSMDDKKESATVGQTGATNVTDSSMLNGKGNGNASPAPGGLKPMDIVPKDADEDSVSQFGRIVAKRMKNLVATEFVTAFWTMKLDDIAVPVDMYESERKRILLAMSAWEKEVDRNRRLTNHIDQERRRRCEAELRRIRDFVDLLDAERKAYAQKQATTLEALKASLGEHRSPLASRPAHDMEMAVNLFLQECVIPRCKLSICDALFCSRFLRMMIELDIPVLCFSTYFRTLLKLTPVVLRSCSENEALGFARLLKEVLTTLEKWRSNRKVFDAEAAGGKKHGFRDPDSSGAQPLRHEQYCEWLFEIHEGLTEGISRVLVAKEYLYTRNSLCILASIAEVFPKVSEHASQLETSVGKMCKSELPDIRLSSTGVLARLKSGHAKRLPRHIFMLKPSAGSAASGGGLAGKGRVSARDDHASKLSAVRKDAKIGKISGSDGRTKTETRTSQVVVSSGVNVNAPRSISKESKRGDQKAALDPSAQEFVPDVQSGRGGHGDGNRMVGGGKNGKRGRDADDSGPNRSSQQAVGSAGRRPHQQELEPHAKRAKGGDERRSDEGMKKTNSGKPNEEKPQSRDASGRSGGTQIGSNKKTAAPAMNSAKGLSQKRGSTREGHARDSGGRDGANRPISGSSSRNGVNRDGSNHHGPGHASKSRDTQARSPPRRDASNRSPGGREAAGRSPQKREPLGRGGQGRDSSGHSPSRRNNGGRSPLRRELLPRAQGNRDAPSRNPGGRDLSRRESSGKDGPGREGNPREDQGRSSSRRESPGQPLQRKTSGGELQGREPNGVSGRDTSRRRRVPDGQGGIQFGPSGDTRIAVRDLPELESFGDGHGMKRRRENTRDAYAFDGDNRRSTRQRAEGAYRERQPSRESPNMRFGGPNSPPRTPGRAFPGQGPPGKSNWGEHTRSRSHDGPHDMRAGNGGPPRRREHELEQGPPWKSRQNDRHMEFEGRERGPVRGRDGPRGGDFGGYEERGPNRGGDRYMDRRNEGREDRGSRDRGFGRKVHARPGGRRRA
ncbi:THO complex subunit 2, putative [Chondrus crispus]|uniref:THO complex subunit 2 n=1 Tax=Chondrus crispus TaxID=2769 RepID=R7QDD4_CHOCR|nr:THO complex subunit 2, putative [Chondrus crispus]CDF35450.1 THO complex subunit 2, putative [Chondrus crispus]|eukprot:XP_005715269.1 THO complex subunit 2, putative [Chondrus crispus]